ncbi:Circadian clock protein kinase KaiC [Methylocystis sp. MJC1]|nr:ATPase domain-containing protein [Methylocystis sp. MJC1]KAF2991027.1 Circadian clock protein kinase KaiC [Methylocystis sp. MJC1]MBU6526053.1 AAA family ATPase [Methylocystis sp. MJC1]
MPQTMIEISRFLTGVPGLDEVLQGGLPRGALILVEGPPGSGKTTVALQFLLAAAQRGETCLLASNAETPEQLKLIVASHGWSLEGVHVTSLSEGCSGAEEAPALDYTLFPEAEVEIGETLQHLFSEVERLKPTLLVLDTISSLRIVAPTPAFHRRQLKRIRDFMAARACTTVMLDEASMTEKDLRSQTLSDGLIELQQVDFHYGADRRRLRVRKLRGCRYLSGAHDFTIMTGGLEVYPRLVAQSYADAPCSEALESGIPEIDTLTGGGIPRGSSTLVVGPAGIGKSTISTLYVIAAAARGEKSCVLLFDENVETYMTRSEGLGLKMRAAKEAGLVSIIHLDPAELSAGQVASLLIRHVEADGAKVVVIDTLNGYLQSATEEPSVFLHIRELISYLSRRQVMILITLTQHGILGLEMATPIDLSFLADNVFLLRYFEMKGALHKALSVVKKRTGGHEHTIRELTVGNGRIDVSEPLEGFSGVLTGTPVFADEASRKGI